MHILLRKKCATEVGNALARINQALLVFWEKREHKCPSRPFQSTTPPVLLLSSAKHDSTSSSLVLCKARQHQPFSRPLQSITPPVLLSCKAPGDKSSARPNQTHTKPPVLLSSSKKDEFQKEPNFETSNIYFSATVEATDNPIAP